MSQRLCIGVVQLNEAWKSLLNQCGLWFEEVDFNAPLTNNYSVIIINAKADRKQISLLSDFAEAGGSILEIAPHLFFFSNKSCTARNVKTLINDFEHVAFPHINFADLYQKVWLHHDSTLFEGFVHFKESKIGTQAFLGVDIAELLQSTGYSRKRFYSTLGQNPDEIVSKVSKHELAEIFRATLKHLHFTLALPYLEKWTSPTAKPVFCFRVDSDFGDQHSLRELYEVFNKHEISATWFLHVEAHQDYLNLFKDFTAQEIALHGYQHGTSASSSKTKQNIELGLVKLNQAGFQISGFCAPYGIWNEALEAAIKEYGFLYTSEFTYAYDGFPLKSTDQELPLQIPIHPICTGNLNRRSYSIQDMKEYFEQVLNSKLSRFEPVLFYHHPLQPGLGAIDQILELVNYKGFENLSFHEFSQFWIERDQFTYEAELHNGRINIKESSDPEKLLQVSLDHKSFDLVSTQKDQIDLTKTSKLKYSMPYLPSFEDIDSMRSTDLQLLKTSLLDWKNRIQL